MSRRAGKGKVSTVQELKHITAVEDVRFEYGGTPYTIWVNAEDIKDGVLLENAVVYDVRPKQTTVSYKDVRIPRSVLARAKKLMKRNKVE